MRTDIEFRTEDGVTLRGWHYRPARGGPWPTIVMAHGYSAVKEMYLDRFAEVFEAAGLAAIVFDNRNFGASDGEPRQEIDPWRQILDVGIAWQFGNFPILRIDRVNLSGVALVEQRLQRAAVEFLKICRCAEYRD